MRHKWAALLGAFALASASLLAAATPAAAAAPNSRLMTLRPGAPAMRLVRSSTVHRHKHQTVTSSNWSGYAATGSAGSFNSVSASWVEPTGHCTSGTQYASLWVGLDGFSSNSVEQTGTDVDCAGKTPRYYAWYEMYPSPAYQLGNPVRPGDEISASVTYAGNGQYNLSIADATQGWIITEHKTLLSAVRSSAEVIVEAPCCTFLGGILPLADFGSASFTSAEVNGAALGTFNPTQIVMASGKTRKDSVSALTAETGYTATWLHQ